MIEYLVIAAAIATSLAALAYIRSMFRGGAKPNRISWLLWMVAPFIGAAAALSNGVDWVAVLPVFMAGFSPLLILAGSLFAKKAYWKLSRFDYFCGGLSGLALVLLYLTSNPNVAILFSILGDALAGIPTLAKGWRHPQSESPWPYITGVFSASVGLFASQLTTFSGYAFPAYLLVINVLLLLAVYNKKIAALARK
jgi:hypothetical protein